MLRWKRKRLRRAVMVSLVSLLLAITHGLMTGCGVHGDDVRWSEGERAWLLALTYPVHSAGDFGVETPEQDRRLLERFAPKVIVAPDGLVPVDFYGYYLPNTVVRDTARPGAVVKKSPARGFLKSIERNKRYYLDYAGALKPCNDCSTYVGAGYGRVYREEATLRTGSGTERYPIVVLKYNFAFPYSGLPARIGAVKEALVRIAADPVKFHELDIHGAVHIILGPAGRPVIIMLAQHNHFRSFLVGKGMAWPEDGHIPVCFAERSNEPYPCPEGSDAAEYRAVGSPADMAYVIDGSRKPFNSGMDKVYGPRGGGVQVDYVLKFLPSRDPLYVSWIPLGDRQKILFFGGFWRKGPPGMELNTAPEVKEYGDLMQFWYLSDGDPGDAEFMARAFRSFVDADFDAVLERNGASLYHDMVQAGLIGGR